MVSFAAEPVVNIGFFSVTNTFIHTLLVDGIIIAACLYLRNKITIIPGKIQNITEFVIDSFYKLSESIAQERGKKIFPYFMTFFLFILIANWTALLPGFNVFGIKEHESLIPLLRGATSDVNVTFGLAIVSIVATHILSIRILGIHEYLSRFFSLNPVYLFIGVLEIISEFTKVISLGFRLFGNIFAGEIVLGTVSGLFAFIVPLPFLTLEIIVGLVQALVFSILTLTFMTILSAPHHEEAKEVRN